VRVSASLASGHLTASRTIKFNCGANPVTVSPGLPQEPRGRCPCRAPAARARLRTNSEAFVAIQTQGELSQRKMHTWCKLSDLTNHRRV